MWDCGKSNFVVWVKNYFVAVFRLVNFKRICISCNHLGHSCLARTCKVVTSWNFFNCKFTSLCEWQYFSTTVSKHPENLPVFPNRRMTSLWASSSLNVVFVRSKISHRFLFAVSSGTGGRSGIVSHGTLASLRRKNQFGRPLGVTTDDRKWFPIYNRQIIINFGNL